MSNTMLPPANTNAEEAVLGCVLIDPDAILELSEFLKPEHFYNVANRWVYEAMDAVHQRQEPVDTLTVIEELRRKGKLLDVGGEAYIVGLISAVPTSLNALAYGRIIADTAQRRALIKVSGEIANLAYDEERPTDEVTDEAQRLIFATAQDESRQRMLPVSRIAANYVERIEAQYQSGSKIAGIPTGFADLDTLLGGLNNSDLIVLGARPGMGKTSLQNAFALHAALVSQKKVGMFNLEMSGEQLVQRMIASEIGIDIQRLRRGQLYDAEWQPFYEAVAKLSAASLFIDDTPSLTPMQLRNKCRRLYAEHGLDLVVVDYLQLMQSDGRSVGNRTLEISEISRSLKTLARELDVPILVASQLSRAVESRQDKRPLLSDLRESGAVEQDSDIVMFIYRDDYYNPDTSERPNIAEINIAKHRNGPTATIDLYWKSETATFANLARGV
jgi:replicative DNA helicase